MEDKILEAFDFGVIQGCATIKSILDEHNISWSEFLEWMEDKSKRIVRSTPRAKIPDIPRKVLKRPCPVCKNWLALEEVNHRPCAMVGGDFKSQWFCYRCGFEDYSPHSIVEEAEPFVEELSVVYIRETPQEQRRRRRRATHKPCDGCNK